MKIYTLPSCSACEEAKRQHPDAEVINFMDLSPIERRKVAKKHRREDGEIEFPIVEED